MLLGGFVQFVVSQFYQKFATDTLLLDSAVIGAIFFASRATDAVLDPVCGYWSDRLRRRRIFIGVGLIALAGGLVIAFLPALDIFAASAVAKYSLAAIGIFTLYIGVTLVYIPHYAWLAALQRALPKLPFFCIACRHRKHRHNSGWRRACGACAIAAKINANAVLCHCCDADAAGAARFSAGDFAK